MFDELIKMLIIYYGALSNNCNFLFESHYQYDLNYNKKVYAYVVNNNFFKMFVRNVIIKSIILTRCVKLNTIIEYNQIECYLVMSKKSHKTASD